MSNEYPPQSPYQPQQPAYAPPVQPPKKGRGKAVLIVLAVFVALGVLASVASNLTGKTTPAAAPAAASSVEQSQPAENPADTEDAVPYSPTKDDFTVSIKVKKKECFGPAGCNIEFRIDPGYVGIADLPDVGTTEVTYKVKGGEDPYTNTFTVDSDGAAHFDKTEMVPTSSSSKKLTAVVTDVEYDENG